MPAATINPLLALVRERELIDDLQMEEVIAEQQRTGKAAGLLLADLGFVDTGKQLQLVADQLATEVVTLGQTDLPPEVVKRVPANIARSFQCLPVAIRNGILQIAVADPLNAQRMDELGFVVKGDIQIVVADPAQIIQGRTVLCRGHLPGFRPAQGTGE
jgi:hypothetical protein